MEATRLDEPDGLARPLDLGRRGHRDEPVEIIMVLGASSIILRQKLESDEVPDPSHR